MLHYPDINPVIVHIVGPLSVRWYGLMYLVSFVVGWSLLMRRLRQPIFSRVMTVPELSDLLFYIAVGTLVGGRVGEMVFYEWHRLVEDPWLLFQVWKGGMSFHGGLLGVIVAVACYAWQRNKPLVGLTDFIAPVVPIGLGAGRLGNFINGELWGRVTDMPWGMMFPAAGHLPRHPSQLYEFLLEGVVLFVVLWLFSYRSRPRGAISGLFLVSYGLFRFGVEFFREPEGSSGFLAWGWLTEGQLLSFPMIVIGAVLLTYSLRNHSCSNT
jgi:phosphatidylglycerol:prolipoprotein diacylglycerol transferase